ncbi:alpha/beta fold hydrolase [Kribbella solani]|uniref:alpha/beta fold hydrolase n=1 Tax=Kribbella solani TaxID=236067 RepID=UPI0029A80357|nr:alpha/beta hydrolase [Kribbella solani]MDX2972239.1 alpha/beta hydrolase [Kribbella solani]
MAQSTTRLVRDGVSLQVVVDGDLAEGDLAGRDLGGGDVGGGDVGGGTAAGSPVVRPAVLVGGLLDGPEVWEPLVPLLSGERALVRISCRGCGDSSAATPSLTVSELAEDVLTVADALRIGTFDLVGVSMGGLVAQEVTLSAPERVASLGLVSSAPCLGENGRFVLRLVRDLVVADRIHEAVQFLAYAGLGPAFAERHPAEFGATVRAVERLPGIAADLVHLIEAMLPFDSRRRLGAITCPTAAVIAVDDLIFAAPCAESLLAYHPQAVLTRMAGGHCAFQSSPGIAAKALLDNWHLVRPPSIPWNK